MLACFLPPLRSPSPPQGEYYEAVCKAVDPIRKELVACFPADAGLDEACFKMSYDVLLVGVGSVNNTFGIQVGGAGRGAWCVWGEGGKGDGGWVALLAAVEND
jgi:hypothetical protein